MSRISGINGDVWIVANGGELDADAAWLGAASWSIDIAGEAPDVSGFDGDGWRERVPGLKGYKTTIEASWETTYTMLSSGGGELENEPLFSLGQAVEVALLLTPQTAEVKIWLQHTGTISRWPIKTEIADAARYSVEILGQGAYTLYVVRD